MLPRLPWKTLCKVVYLSVAVCGNALTQDWPQFNGPTRDGKLPEQYTLGSIPSGGLPKLWSTPISGGYSGIAVQAGNVIVTDFVLESGEVTNNAGAADQLKGQERVHCLDATTGKSLWVHSDYREVNVSFGIGPRATPTIDSGMVFTLGSEGDLLALKLQTGELVWRLSLKKKYGVQTPLWGYASSPLVVDERLITLAGGEGSLVVALNKSTGEEIWRTGSSSSIGYCPPMLIGKGDEQQLLVWDPDKLNGIDLNSGKLLWTEPLKPLYEMSIAPPLEHNGMLYVSGIGETSGMYRIKPGRAGLERIWSEKSPRTAVYLSNAAGIFRDKMIVGADNGSGKLIAIDPVDGKRYWETMKPTANTDRRASHGTAFIFGASNGCDYLFSETGDFIIAKLTPESYEEVSRQHLVDATNYWQNRDVVWSYPAFANGNIFVRNDKEIACFDLTP